MVVSLTSVGSAVGLVAVAALVSVTVWGPGTEGLASVVSVFKLMIVLAVTGTVEWSGG